MLHLITLITDNQLIIDFQLGVVLSSFILKLGDILQYLETVLTITTVYDIDPTSNEWVVTIDDTKTLQESCLNKESPGLKCQ